MQIVTSSAKAEITIKRSRFISIIVSTTTQEDAKSAVQAEWERYPDATHVVYAFRIGKKGDLFGMSDDGEPHGTAGRPVLEVLKGSGITNALLLVVRYFGGTKLGTGGLVKAYTQAAQEAISRCQTEELTEKVAFQLSLPYQLHDPVLKLLHEYGAMIEDEQFATEVTLKGTLPERVHIEVGDRIRDLSSGSVSLQILTDPA